MGYNAAFSTVFGDSAGEVGNSMQTLSFGTGRKVVDFATGYSHTCAILDNGKLKCIGYNATGQLGIGNTATIGDSVLETGDVIAYTDIGTGRSVRTLSLGIEVSFAIRDDGTAIGWGSNDYYQLGTRTSTIGDGAGEMGDVLPSIYWGNGVTAKRVIAGRDRGN